MQMIKDITGKSPILLLDDIFDKLDDNRVSQLIALVNKENFGQILLQIPIKTVHNLLYNVLMRKAGFLSYSFGQ